MKRPPGEFLRLISKHNRHVVWMALMCLLGALILWHVIIFFLILILLGLTTAVLGDWGDAIPRWIYAVAIGLAAFLLIWGSIDQWIRRYSPTQDRAIIGFHVIGDAMLMPARVTFGIWGNLGALLFLSPRQKVHAWTILQAMQRAGKIPAHAMGQLDENADRLNRSVHALQMLNLVSRYPGELEAYYLVHQEKVQMLMDSSARRG